MSTDLFSKLNSINVNERTEKKQGLTYLSWAWAWTEFCKVCPGATYKVWRDESGKPYTFDESLGYMVFVSVSASGITHEMWLPVMDGANKAQRAVDYEYTTRSGNKACKAATMFDINTAIMRCLVKCLAMFGLGTYIYAGEDLPEISQEDKEAAEQKAKKEEEEKQVKYNEKLQKHKDMWRGGLLALDIMAVSEAFEASGFVTDKDDPEEAVDDLLSQVDTLTKLKNAKELAKKRHDEIEKSLNTDGQ